MTLFLGQNDVSKLLAPGAEWKSPPETEAAQLSLQLPEAPLPKSLCNKRLMCKLSP